MNKLQQIGAGLNGYTLNFDQSLLDEIRDSYSSKLQPILTNPDNHRLFEGGRVLRQPVGAADSDYYLVSFQAYPLLWLSSNTPAEYQIYRRFYDNLGIEDEVRSLVDHHEKIIMYCGFLVVGENSPEIRRRALTGLEFLGLGIDGEANSCTTADADISAPRATARTIVVG